MVTAQQEEQPVGRWKLGSRLKSAVLGVKSGSDFLIGLVQQGCIGFVRGRKRKSFAQLGGNADSRILDLFFIGRPEILDLPANVDQACPARAAVFGEIGSGEKRLFLPVS